MFTDILILGNLIGGPKHGYDIKRAIEKRMGGTYRLTNSQIYPALKSLEEMGAITREVVRQEGRPDRHLYRMTSLGQDVLHQMVMDFPEDKARRDAEFFVRLAYFRYLSRTERIAILEARKRQVEARAENVATWLEAPDAYVRGLGQLRMDTFGLELQRLGAWIAGESDQVD